MRGSRLVLTGAVVGVIGLALLMTEALRAVSGNQILSTTAQLLMWVGLGVTAVGGVLLVIGAFSTGPADEI